MWATPDIEELDTDFEEETQRDYGLPSEVCVCVEGGGDFSEFVTVIKYKA